MQRVVERRGKTSQIPSRTESRNETFARQNIRSALCKALRLNARRFDGERDMDVCARPFGEMVIMAYPAKCHASLKALASRVRPIRRCFRPDANMDQAVSRTRRPKLTQLPTSSYNASSPKAAVPEPHLALVPTTRQPYTCSCKVAGYLRHG